MSPGLTCWGVVVEVLEVVECNKVRNREFGGIEVVVERNEGGVT
jgi:hypothetical protein